MKAAALVLLLSGLVVCGQTNIPGLTVDMAQAPVYTGESTPESERFYFWAGLVFGIFAGGSAYVVRLVRQIGKEGYDA